MPRPIDVTRKATIPTAGRPPVARTPTHPRNTSSVSCVRHTHFDPNRWFHSDLSPIFCHGFRPRLLMTK
jgi:hypothetical protein